MCSERTPPMRVLGGSCSPLASRQGDTLDPTWDALLFIGYGKPTNAGGIRGTSREKGFCW